MEIDGSGDESAAAAAAATSTDPGRGRKRPPSPSTPTPSDDGEDSDDGWAVSDSGSEEEEEEYDDEEEQEGMHRPFTVDDFPRLSSDHSVQTDALYDIPHLRLRGPSPLSLFRAFNDPLTDKRMHCTSLDCIITHLLVGMACLPLTSPARGICITSRALFEFQLCIRTEDSPEAEDEPIVQATVDVEIIHSPACGLNLKLYAKTSGFSDVIRLFRGVAQSGRRIRSLVAVVRRSHLDLCIEGSPADIGLGEKLPCVRWEHKFGAGFHRTADEVVKLGDFTTISLHGKLSTSIRRRRDRGASICNGLWERSPAVAAVAAAEAEAVLRRNGGRWRRRRGCTAHLRLMIFQGLVVIILRRLKRGIDFQIFAFKALCHSFFSVPSTILSLTNAGIVNVNSARTVDCLNGCRCHSMNLLQLIDLKISGYRHTQPGRAKIFGFFAVRDDLEPLRNYVFRHAIDNYEAVSVKPKTLEVFALQAVHCLNSNSVFGLKTHLRLRDEPKPKGGTLIEGCTEFTNILRSTSFTETVRLYGEKCGLGVKFLLLVNAVQATVDVEIIHSPACGLNLKLYAKTSGFSDVLRLFRGVAQSSHKISSVVAVVRRSHLDLCIEGSPADIDLGEKLPCTRWEHRFGAGFHGTVEEVVKLGDFTTISVKVTWKAVSKLPP
uniref:DUF6598 domain-containing protein n=1 Tax=Oryza rufipogon TaxID=4529 RepID=A0A0E0RJ14_ORYRU